MENNNNRNNENNENKQPTNREQQFARLLEVTAEARAIKENLINTAKTAEQAFFYETLTINHIILNMIYKKDNPEITEFKKFREWKQEGATVRKGAKAFVIWGQPVAAQRREEAKQKGQPQPETDQADETRFPMCYIFADTQVLTKEAKEAAKMEAEAERRAAEAAAIFAANTPEPVAITIL